MTKLISNFFFLKSLTFCSLFFLEIGFSIDWQPDVIVPDNASGDSFRIGENGESDGGATWREPSGIIDAGLSTSSVSTDTRQSSERFVGPKTTRFSYELNSLPNQNGQFWIVYDITPFTERFSSTTEPQKSIVEWIRFDSGKDFWHKEPFCILSASRERLYVYHNADVQQYVSNVVDRFIDPTKSVFTCSIRVVAVQSPEWRLRAIQYLTPASLRLEGNGVDAQGWIVERDHLKKIIGDLEKRSDYLELNDSGSKVPNGNTFGWAAAAPRKTLARDYRIDLEATSGYRADVSSIDEGYRVEATPLLSIGGETLEVTFRYNATVVERTKTFGMRVPTTTSPRQQLEVERPHIVSCDVCGKISFPRTKSFIVDLGMVPLTGAKKINDSKGGVAESVSNFVGVKTSFYDVLIIFDSDE